ncbi:MAG TPA: PD-(D/E)XK nuclease family protein [Bryobacteraceae bacterium]|nr:PD-(D/E)XK nuclease family protein [Bryobacteraceae bacterium]
MPRGPRARNRLRTLPAHLRRVYIFLRPDNRFAIGIENKPRAADQPGWVKDYSDHLTNKYGDGYLLIYLTAVPGDPSGDDERAAKGLGRKFLNISYKKDIKNWLEACRDACRADKVRGFLKDFINYVKVMEETEMLSEQDRTLIVDYICDHPVGRLKVAYSVTSTWRDVQRRIVKDFQAALATSLAVDFGDSWSVTPVQDDKLLDKWNEFKVTKG